MSKSHQAEIDSGALLYAAAVRALTNNSMSPIAALGPFFDAVTAGGGIGGALILWGDDTANDLCLAYLRHVLRAMRNEPEPMEPKRANIVTSKHAPIPSSNRRSELKSADLERMRRGRIKSYASIYQETTIDGRPFHELTRGEAKSLIPVKRRRAQQHISEATRENFEADVLELSVNHAQADDTTPLVEMVSARQLQKFVASLKEKADV
jgi:hypothetical protein